MQAADPVPIPERKQPIKTLNCSSSLTKNSENKDVWKVSCNWEYISNSAQASVSKLILKMDGKEFDVTKDKNNKSHTVELDLDSSPKELTCYLSSTVSITGGYTIPAPDSSKVTIQKPTPENPNPESQPETGLNELPQPRGEFVCPPDESLKGNGKIQIVNAKYKSTPLGGDQFRITLEWDYDQVNQFLQKVYGTTLEEKANHYGFRGEVFTKTTSEDEKRLIYFDHTTRTFGGEFTINPNEERSFKIKIALCWKEQGLALTRPTRIDWMGFNVTVPHSTEEIEGPITDVSSASQPGEGACDCPTALLEHVACRAMCGFLDFLARGFNEALYLMEKWSGL